MIEMISAGRKPKAANNYASSINSFLTWLFKNKHTETRLRIPLQRSEKLVLRTYSAEEVKKILAFTPRTFGEKRMMAILYLLTDTGVRVDEALTLTRSKIDFDKLVITVYGKGRKERKVPFSDEVRDALRQWLKEHNHDLVFSTQNGTKVQHDNARHELKTILKKVGV